MAKKVGQIRYYGYSAKKAEKNYPENLTVEDLRLGLYFINKLPQARITQFGIQTLPGVQFFINGAQSPILIGSTGIYELDVTGLTEISSITFSMPSLEMINASATGYLIIDFVYEEGE